MKGKIMSGGSFNYLCFKECLEEITKLSALEDLQRMVDELAKLGYAKDVALETQDLLLDLRAFDVRVTQRLKRLQPVWRGLEWWDSGDTREDSFKETLAIYRKENCNKADTLGS